MSARQASEIRNQAYEPEGGGFPEGRPPEIRAALERVLASPQFVKSYRMSRLLRFIVENALENQNARLKEYCIGVEVFDRDGNTYNPAEDPIVRVQMRRLREKLNQYYAQEGDGGAIQFDVPVGGYSPVFKRVEARPRLAGGLACAPPPGGLYILPLLGIGQGASGSQFADGLSEELLHHLLDHLGPYVMLRRVSGMSEAAMANIAEPAAYGSHYLLEGSVRHHASRVRVSVRLLDIQDRSLKWSAQFDDEGGDSLLAQEVLALGICRGLKSYLSSHFSLLPSSAYDHAVAALRCRSPAPSEVCGVACGGGE